MARFLKNKQKSQGAAPGSLIFIGEPRMEQSHIRVIQYTPAEVKEEKLTSFASLSGDLSPDQVTWITLCGLHNTSLIGEMGQKFNINTLMLEDILNTDERPKFAEDDEHLYILLKSLNFNQATGKVEMEQISLIVGAHYLLTVQETDINYFSAVTQRIKTGTSKIRNLPTDYLCYTLIDTLVDNYILNIEKLGSVIEEQEKKLLSADKKIIEDIYHDKTELSYIRKNIRPVKELMTRFVTSDSDLIHDRTYNYLRDLQGLVTQALEALEIYYTMVSDQQNSYNANISNNVNDVMKILTIFSAIFIPLTFIVGVYGTNFAYIPALKYHDAYFALWGVMVTIAAIMLLFFKRKKWL